MYAKYTWNAGATASQVLADLILLATGTTNIASLSASCDKPNSEVISNTTPTNWTVYDAAPAAGQGSFATGTSQVLRSLNADATTYKYCQLAVSATYLAMAGWESWNATAGTVTNLYPGSSVIAHAGFNQTFTMNSAYGGSWGFSQSFANAGTAYIFATPRYLIVAPSPSLVATGFTAVGEFSRDSNSTDITYPCVWIMAGSANMYNSTGFGISRVKKPAAVGDFGMSTGTNLATGGSLGFSSILNPTNIVSSNSVTQMASTLGVGEVPYTSALPYIIAGATSSAQSMILGKVQGGLLQLYNIIPTSTSMDEIVVGATTYVIVKNAAGAMLVPKA